MSLMTVEKLGEATVPSPLSRFVGDDVFVPATVEWKGGGAPEDPRLFEMAGPRERLFFDPCQTRAGLVTCGGLCPGLNNVIRSVVLELNHGYGVREVLGFQDGYRGLDPFRGQAPIALTPGVVDDIHRDGGTILGTSRGPVDIPTAVDYLVKRGVNLLFTVGGDGTQRGGSALFEEAQRRQHPLAVVGIPKTIDNDVMFVDRTFGFTTAVDAAREVIDCAHTEAHSVFNGVSVVKLMGRHAGFIAAAASVASQDVNFCFIPEVPFRLEGERGFLHALKRRLASRKHAVIVVAEGAGQDLFSASEAPKDASGNLKLQDIGRHLCEVLGSWSKTEKVEMTLRYFDPSYQIRSRAANTEDSMLCDRFARNAVHAAMSGRTGLIIGMLFGQFVHVPIRLLSGQSRQVKLRGELWRAVLSATGQPELFE